MGALSGKTALVVGASKGLGRAIALGYAQEGATVICLGRDRAALDSLHAEIHDGGGRAIVRPFDLLEPDAYPRLVEWIRSEGFPVSVIVHTPGGGLHALAISDQRIRAQIEEGRGIVPFWQIDDQDVDRVLELGVKSVTKFCKYLAPLLMERGTGSIIVLGSGAGVPGNQRRGHYISIYCAEKGAVIAYVLTVAHEVQSKGVAANVLLPGGIMLTTLIKGYPKAEANPNILPPDAVVPAAVFLAQQDSNGVTGQLFNAREYALTQAGDGTKPVSAP